jgi:hypothetical protein
LALAPPAEAGPSSSKSARTSVAVPIRRATSAMSLPSSHLVPQASTTTMSPLEFGSTLLGRSGPTDPILMRLNTLQDFVVRNNEETLSRIDEIRRMLDSQ